GSRERPDDRVWFHGSRFTVPPIDEYCITARRAAGEDVLRAVADEEAPTEVDGQAVGRRDQESWLGLAAPAALVLAVRAHLDGIDTGPAGQGVVHGLDHFAGDESVADIGLVGYDDHEKTSLAQALHGSAHAGEQPEFVHSPWRVGLALADLGAVQHAVAIHEHRRLHWALR